MTYFTYICRHARLALVLDTYMIIPFVRMSCPGSAMPEAAVVYPTQKRE